MPEAFKNKTLDLSLSNNPFFDSSIKRSINQRLEAKIVFTLTAEPRLWGIDVGNSLIVCVWFFLKIVVSMRVTALANPPETNRVGSQQVHRPHDALTTSK